MNCMIGLLEFQKEYINGYVNLRCWRKFSILHNSAESPRSIRGMDSTNIVA